MTDARRHHGLACELEWLGRKLGNCLISLGLHDGQPEPEEAPALPQDDAYAELVRRHRLGEAERLVLALSLLPHVKPETLNALARSEAVQDRLGCVPVGRDALPTVHTALTLLSHGRLDAYLDGYRVLDDAGPLMGQGLLRHGPHRPLEGASAGLLIPDEAVLSRLVQGRPYTPRVDEFPARAMHTDLGWEDLILPPPVRRQIDDILVWIERGAELRDALGLGGHLRPGYKALFYGPPGTGKTLSAALIGRHTGREVYRVDLSQVVSKYIGETEKNLEHLFRQAERRDWILFFDEADALFGKRTEVEDAHDRHANQETAFLLQRLEHYPALVIMASNLSENIDPAFTRRFNSAVFFPLPGRRERERLWQACLGQTLRLEPEAREWLVEQELSGGQIANTALRLGLWALRGGDVSLGPEAARRAVMLERMLEGRA